MRALLIALALAGIVAPITAAVAADASQKQSYCVNDEGDFYPYQTGSNCKPGYQLTDGNCRLKDGRMIAVARSECQAQAGEVNLPAPAARFRNEPDPKAKPQPQPLTIQDPKTN